MPLMGELRVLMGEWSWPGDPKAPPMPVLIDGWREGAVIGPPLLFGELKEVELTGLEKSVKRKRKKYTLSVEKETRGCIAYLY